MTYRVQLPETGEVFDADASESVLSAALKASVTLPSDCRQGGCGTCRIRLLKGAVAYEEFPLALTHEEAAAGFALACQARATSDLQIRVASPALQDPERYVALIKEIRPLSADVTHVALEIPGSAGLDYLPGQYMKVRLNDGSTRNFSMASKPDGSTADFHVRRIVGGRFTDGILPRLRALDKLAVELPHGSFFYRQQDYRPLLMVATGTGIAPIRSILESLLDDPDCPPMTLYWGMRTRSDLYLHEEMHSWRHRLGGFRYVPVLSRADPSWTGRRGYVQHAACADFDDLSRHATYLCGSPNMIAAARQAFAAKGASIDYLYADSFTFQHAPTTEEELT